MFRKGRGWRVAVRASVGQGRFALAVGSALNGAFLACAPAQAQVEPVEIGTRIESAFDLVESNPLDLAVPLTRLALARRSVERESPADEEVRLAVSGEAEFSAIVIPAANEAGAAELEQGSADDPDDPDIARLPRPRPLEPGAEEQQAALIGRPLDLVAVASSLPAEAEPASDPQPLLVAAATAGEPEGEPSGLVAAIQPAEPAAAIPSRELVAAGDCVAVGEVTDKDEDFSRNAELLSGAGFCIAEIEVEERKSWKIQTISTDRPGPLWAVLHDDEDVSFDNAVEALNTYGGKLITVDAGGKRLYEGIDPNRNFSADGIGCSKLGEDATPRFTLAFRGLFDPSQPIIALHNNASRQASTGGHGHASMTTIGKAMRASPAADADGPLAGDDTLVLLAATDEDDAAAAAATIALNERGINVVLEVVSEGRGDCSFSNYAILSGHTNFYNVTVDEDEADKQKKIVDAIMAGRPAPVATQ